ncbi:hypothetical protein NMG60_11009307 [Bertholletia excelsa]
MIPLVSLSLSLSLPYLSSLSPPLPRSPSPYPLKLSPYQATRSQSSGPALARPRSSTGSVFIHPPTGPPTTPSATSASPPHPPGNPGPGPGSRSLTFPLVNYPITSSGSSDGPSWRSTRCGGRSTF